MELLLALPAGQPIPNSPAQLTPVHMAYRLGDGFQLLASPCPVQGGLMMVDNGAGSGSGGDPLSCCRQIVDLCQQRGHSGIICDFDRPLEQFLTLLDRECANAGLSLFVPECGGSFAPNGKVLIPSPLVSGSLEGVLHSAMQQYGKERTVLAIQWQREDLKLPTNGRGQTLTSEVLEEQLRTLQPATFFDRGLCAHYYTYMATGGQAHFVVFDTPQSIRAKISLAQNLDLSAVLMAEPEVGTDLSAVLGT